MFKSSDSLRKPVPGYVLLICVFITGLIPAACKKKGKEPIPGSTGCRVTQIVAQAEDDTFQVSYNNIGTVRALTGRKSDIRYSYAGNITTRTKYSLGNFVQKSIITHNAAGLATNIRFELNEAGTLWDNEAYEYAGEEVTRMIFTSSRTQGGDTVLYAWEDHNMVRETGQGFPNDPIQYAYYTDQPRQYGDWFFYIKLFQGYEVFRCRNSLQSISGMVTVSLPFVYLIRYAFDGDGKIVSVTGQYNNNNPMPLLIYGYHCQ